ncbi:MAG: GNAT family N-acetyltransferase [Candidatus Marinimicrobia bacterium]|nr:GNAT family N-acetyltransferase [Candidatus Neomarinimicrobiota bacterium]
MIDIVRYDENTHSFWDAFVRASNNGTLFHERQFLNYHPAERFADHSLVFLEESKPIALFPAVDHAADGIRTLHSHRGSSYGGIVQPAGQGVEKNMKIVRALNEYARHEGFNRIVMTLPPDIYCRQLNNYLEFACFRQGYTYLKREISSVLKLENRIEKNIALFKSSNRTAFRRGEKQGVVVRLSDDYRSFYGILKNNLKIRHGVEPTHTLDELLELKRRYPERIRLYGAYIGTAMIAGIVMFDANEQVTLAFYISHDEQYQEYRGVNVLFKDVIADCIKRGFRYLDYGIFTVNMEPNYGLARFKESFGAGGIFRDTLMLDIG